MTFISYRELNSLGLLDEFKRFEAAKNKGEEFEISDKLKEYFKKNNLYEYRVGFVSSKFQKAPIYE